MPSGIPFTMCLPDAAHLVVRFDHGLAGLAAERLTELRHVHHHAVDAVLPRRMWIGYGIDPLVFRPLVLTSPLRESDKETLVGRQPVHALKRSSLGCVLPRDISPNGSAQVGHVFAFRQLG